MYPRSDWFIFYLISDWSTIYSRSDWFIIDVFLQALIGFFFHRVSVPWLYVYVYIWKVIPLVMEPRSRMYTDPVIVLDFQSLYPSVIIAHNFCFSTCLGKLSHHLAGTGAPINDRLGILAQYSKQAISEMAEEEAAGRSSGTRYFAVSFVCVCVCCAVLCCAQRVLLLC